MGEELDPSLEPVLAKAFVKRGNATLIKLGDKEIDFNPDFRLYITTKLGVHPAASSCMLWSCNHDCFVPSSHGFTTVSASPECKQCT